MEDFQDALKQVLIFSKNAPCFIISYFLCYLPSQHSFLLYSILIAGPTKERISEFMQRVV